MIFKEIILGSLEVFSYSGWFGLILKLGKSFCVQKKLFIQVVLYLFILTFLFVGDFFLRGLKKMIKGSFLGRQLGSSSSSVLSIEQNLEQRDKSWVCGFIYKRQILSLWGGSGVWCVFRIVVILIGLKFFWKFECQRYGFFFYSFWVFGFEWRLICIFFLI